MAAGYWQSPFPTILENNEGSSEGPQKQFFFSYISVIDYFFEKDIEKKYHFSGDGEEVF